MKKKYGLDITWQKLGKIMEAYKDDESKGSPPKTGIKAVGVINDIKKEGLEAAMKKNQNMNDDIVMTVVKRYLENRDGKYSDLLKSVRAKTSASAILTELEEMKKRGIK